MTLQLFVIGLPCALIISLMARQWLIEGGARARFEAEFQRSRLR